MPLPLPPPPPIAAATAAATVRRRRRRRARRRCRCREQIGKYNRDFARMHARRTAKVLDARWHAKPTAPPLAALFAEARRWPPQKEVHAMYQWPQYLAVHKTTNVQWHVRMSTQSQPRRRLRRDP
jgi:hypothetical protein